MYHACIFCFVKPVILFCYIFQLHNGVLPELPDTKCPVCDREYQSFERQMRHIFELHQDYWQIFSGGRPLEVFIRQREIKHREKRFSCEICKKYYSHETGYLKHMATHPEMSNLKMTFWTCQVCQKVFTKLSFLERHMDMKADDAHKRALADYKFSNSAKFRGVIAAAAGSAATQEGVSASEYQMSVENSIDTASRPVFPTANSVVTSAIQPKDLDVTPTTSRNSWKVHGGFPSLNAQPNDNRAHVSFSPVSQFNNGTEKAEQTLSQSTTFSNISAATADTKSGIITSTDSSKELNTNSENARHENKKSNDNSAEQSRKAILSVPQGLSPTANLANQFPPNTISPRLASDGMFPAVSSSYRPMTPLEQLALAGSSMMHNPTALVPGFPMRSSHMAMPPMSAAGMVAAHSHLPIPRLPDPSDQEDIASALQSIANQVNTSK